jgi:nucleoside-diphosphate-sugar epimerase
MNNKISVFGGTGFIGSRFYEIYKDVVYVEPRESNVPKYDDVLYLISTTDNYNVLTDVHLDINTNLNKLMDILPNVKGNISYVSSWFVYGEVPIPAKEWYSCKPKGFYSITKLAAEQLLESYCKTFDIKYRILRLCNVYGPNDKGKGKKKNALQYLIEEMKQGHDINLYHGGNFIRDYMYVDDICRAIKLCIDKGPVNEVVNIGSGTHYKFLDLIEYVSKKIGYKGRINTINPTKFHEIVQVKDFCLDNTKLRNLGFNNKITIEEGLDSLL